MTHIAIGPRLRKPVFGDLQQSRRRSACASAQSHQQLCCLLFEIRINSKINFLASLFSRRDWFENRFVELPEDRFSRVVACVACSTDLGQILQLQQILREFEKEPEELMFNIGLTKQHRTHSGLTGVTS